MQDPRIMNSKKQKLQRTMIPQIPEDYVRGTQEVLPTMPLKNVRKVSKKSMKNDVPPFYRQERPKSSAQPESPVANEYRALRRKFLLLEEESYSLGNELIEVEDEMKKIEDEKLELLDQLVVLEGLVDPSELHYQ